MKCYYVVLSKRKFEFYKCTSMVRAVPTVTWKQRGGLHTGAARPLYGIMFKTEGVRTNSEPDCKAAFTSQELLSEMIRNNSK